jgi:hypothetical protein
MFRFTIRDVLWLMVVVAMGCGTSGLRQKGRQEVGFWTFASDRKWEQVEGGALDRALTEFTRLKETYGDSFNVVVEDLHAEGAPTSDGSETAKIHIKVYVSPRNAQIETRLKELGLVYVER